MIFYCRFELPEAFTTRIHQKNVQKPSKKAKNTAEGTNILPQKAKVLLLLFYLIAWGLYSARDKVSFSEIIRQNPLNMSGKKCKNSAAKLGHPHQTYSFFSLAVATCWATNIGLRLFRFEYDELRMCMK